MSRYLYSQIHVVPRGGLLLVVRRHLNACISLEVYLAHVLWQSQYILHVATTNLLLYSRPHYPLSLVVGVQISK